MRQLQADAERTREANLEKEVIHSWSRLEKLKKSYLQFLLLLFVSALISTHI